MKKFLLTAGFLFFNAIASPLVFGQSSDGLAPSSVPGVVTFHYLWNGTAWDRLHSADNKADGVNGNGMPPNTTYVYNGTNWERARTSNTFKTLSAVVITAEATIWTPAAGKKFRLMGYCIAQGVVTGAVTLKDGAAGPTIMIIPQHTVGVSQCSPLLGNGILSSTANNPLRAIGASTETITGYVFGTEE